MGASHRLQLTTTSPLLLNWRKGHSTVRAEHTAVTRLRLEQRFATRELIEIFRRRLRIQIDRRRCHTKNPRERLFDHNGAGVAPRLAC